MDVAEALCIHPVMLYRWCMETRNGVLMAKKKDINIDPKMRAELKRLQKLEREHNLLKQEHDLLKKAIQFSLDRKKKSFEFIDTQRGKYTLTLMCRVYDVKREGYYSWRKRGRSYRSYEDEYLYDEILEVFNRSGKIYGSPKITRSNEIKGL